DYQLPNMTAHNETCANIGNVLWNWRMFLLTGDSKYADIVELALYNSVLSGISMDGTKFFYQSTCGNKGLSLSSSLGGWKSSLYQQIELLSAKYGKNNC